ncbi:hypothetical protein J6590_044730 [Homalodisca vitripennis]|nr:hypothetical protein J6590_044730 [Homalodisca vitripennis]
MGAVSRSSAGGVSATTALIRAEVCRSVDDNLQRLHAVWSRIHYSTRGLPHRNAHCLLMRPTNNCPCHYLRTLCKETATTTFSVWYRSATAFDQHHLSSAVQPADAEGLDFKNLANGRGSPFSYVQQLEFDAVGDLTPEIRSHVRLKGSKSSRQLPRISDAARKRKLVIIHKRTEPQRVVQGDIRELGLLTLPCLYILQVALFFLHKFGCYRAGASDFLEWKPNGNERSTVGGASAHGMSGGMLIGPLKHNRQDQTNEADCLTVWEREVVNQCAVATAVLRLRGAQPHRSLTLLLWNLLNSSPLFQFPLCVVCRGTTVYTE